MSLINTEDKSMLSFATLILLPILVFLLGLLVTTLLGSGGSGIYVPPLILACGIEPQIAVAIGSFVHRRILKRCVGVDHVRQGANPREAASYRQMMV
jgi:hypothetical protein